MKVGQFVKMRINRRRAKHNATQAAEGLAKANVPTIEYYLKPVVKPLEKGTRRKQPV